MNRNNRPQSRTRRIGEANSSTWTISGEKLNRSISISREFALSILCIVIEFFSSEKYNCDTFIVSGIALFIAFIYLPKMSQQMYKYEFLVSVVGEKQILKVELPYGSINTANINTKYTILNILSNMGKISTTDQELEVSLELDGKKIGALTLESDCFNIGKEKIKNEISTTPLTIKGDIRVSINGKDVGVINNIPILINTIFY